MYLTLKIVGLRSSILHYLALFLSCIQGSICRWGCWGLTPALVSVTPVLVWEIRTRWGRILTPALLLHVFSTAEGVLFTQFSHLIYLIYYGNCLPIPSVTNVVRH